MNKTLKTRVQLKHDIEENWLKATNFTPLNGEAIIYDADAAHGYPRAKIGDGVTNVNELPWFVGTPIDLEEFEKLLADKADIYYTEEKKITKIATKLSDLKVGDNLSGITFDLNELATLPTTIFTLGNSMSLGYDDQGNWGAAEFPTTVLKSDKVYWDNNYGIPDGTECFGIWYYDGGYASYLISKLIAKKENGQIVADSEFTFDNRSGDVYTITAINGDLVNDLGAQQIKIAGTEKEIVEIIPIVVDPEYNYNALQNKADNYYTTEKKTIQKSLSEIKVGDNLSGVTIVFDTSKPAECNSTCAIYVNEYSINYQGGGDERHHAIKFGRDYDDKYYFAYWIFDMGWGALIPSYNTVFYNSTSGWNVSSYTFPEVDDDRYVVYEIQGNLADESLYVDTKLETLTDVEVKVGPEYNFNKIDTVNNNLKQKIDESIEEIDEKLNTKANIYNVEGKQVDCQYNYDYVTEVKEEVQKTLGSIDGIIEAQVKDKIANKSDVYQIPVLSLADLKVGSRLSGTTITWGAQTLDGLIQQPAFYIGSIIIDPDYSARETKYMIGYQDGEFGIFERTDSHSVMRLVASFLTAGSYTLGGIVSEITPAALSPQYNQIITSPSAIADCEYNYRNKADKYVLSGKNLSDVKVGDNLSGVTLYFDDVHSVLGGDAQIIFNEHTYHPVTGEQIYSCIKTGDYLVQIMGDYYESFDAFGYWTFDYNTYNLTAQAIFCLHNFNENDNNRWLMASYTFPEVNDDRYVIREIIGDIATDEHFIHTGIEPNFEIDPEYNYNHKVEKTNEAWRLYGTTREGIQKPIPYAFSQDTPSSIPMRDYKGRIFAQTNDEPINDPELMDADYQLVNLKYVKENVSIEKGAGAGSVQQKAAAASTGITVDYSNGTGTITVGSDVPAGTEFDIVGYSKNKEYSYRQHVKVGEMLSIPECKSFVPDIERNGVDIDVAKSYVTLDLREYGLIDLATNSIDSASIGDINLMGYIEYAEGTKGIFNLDTSALYKKIWGKKTLTLFISNNNIGPDLLNKNTTYQIPVYIFYGITTADELSFRNSDADGKLGLERYVTMLPDTVNSEGVTVKHHVCEGNFRLMNDIDFKGTAENINYPQLGLWSQNLDGAGATGWNYRFKGVFDGCGYTMKNISMYQVSNKGLIACISSEGVVKNLFLDNVIMKGTLGYTDVMSGVVCTSNYGLIKNVYVFGYMNIPTSQDWAPPALICAKNDNGIITDCGAVVVNCDLDPAGYGNAITRSEGNSASHCVSLKLEGMPILATSIIERDEATKTMHVPGQPDNITYYGRAKQIKRQLSTDRVPSDLSFQSFEDFEMFLKYGYDEYNTYGRNALGMRDLLDRVAKFALSNGFINAASTVTFTTNKNIINSVVIEYPATAAANSAQSVALGNGTIANGEGVAALGRYNEGDDNNILEVGIGSAQDRKTAFAITNDGRAQVSALPSGPNDVVNLAHLNNRYRHLITISFDPSVSTTYGSNKFTFKTIVENDSKFPLTDFGYFFNEVESKGQWSVAGECSVNGTNYGTGYLTVTRPAITDTIATYSNLFNFTLQLTGSAGNSTITLKYVDTTLAFVISDTTMKIGGYEQ